MRAEPEPTLHRAVAVHRDVIFASPVGFRPLSLDLYLPPGPTPALCLYLHGGGWRVGGRADGPGRARNWSPSFFEQVAALGLAIASIDYRLSGEAVFPAQREDVAEAARFLAAHRDDYGLAASRTVAWGVSAAATSRRCTRSPIPRPRTPWRAGTRPPISAR